MSLLVLCGAALATAEPIRNGILSQIFAPPLSTELPSLADGHGPRVTPRWSANYVQMTGSSSLGTQKGKFFYDAAMQRWRMTGCYTETIFRPDDEMCIDQLAKNLTAAGYNVNMTVGKGADAVCKAVPSPYYDILFMFLLPQAVHEGDKTVDGTPCEVWTASFNIPSYSMNLSTCIAADGVPREHNITSNMAYKAASAQHFRFSNVIIGPPDESIFAPTDACEKRYPMPPCANGSVETLDVYRVRSPKEPNVLDNRNVGDALGDMAFFCGVGGMDETQVVTHWSVQTNSSWGQYAYCLYTGGKNICFGNTGEHVGRESAEGLGKGAVQGQCSENDVVGSWFSFPANGSCAEGARIGDQGCTWAGKPCRTVSASCILNDRGLKEACAKERSHAPMTKSAAIFKAALESSDPAQGGCPDIPAVDDGKILVV
jgi:hypothetical protein